MEQKIKVAYLVKAGDTLEKIAKRFGTTVAQILKENKHIKAGFVYINDFISITPNTFFQSGIKPEQMEPQEQLETTVNLCNLMHKRFGEIFFWTYSYIVSSLENTNDITYIRRRISLIPEELANVFRPYYTEEEIKKIEALFREHLLIIGRLIAALKLNAVVEYNRLNEELYKNADELAKEFVNLNPNLEIESLQTMFYTYLDTILEIIINRRNQTFVQEFDNIDVARQKIFQIANYISQGLRTQFPTKL